LSLFKSFNDINNGGQLCAQKNKGGKK